MTVELPDGLCELDRGVLELLLAGEDPVLKTLRAQLAASEVRSREETGVGFFTYFSIPDSAPRFAPDVRIVFGDVGAYDDRDDPIAGFIVFVEEGVLSNLEGFCYVGDWPLDNTPYTLNYQAKPRDWAKLRRALRGEV